MPFLRCAQIGQILTMAECTYHDGPLQAKSLMQRKKRLRMPASLGAAAIVARD